MWRSVFVLRIDHHHHQDHHQCLLLLFSHVCSFLKSDYKLVSVESAHRQVVQLVQLPRVLCSSYRAYLQDHEGAFTRHPIILRDAYKLPFTIQEETDQSKVSTLYNEAVKEHTVLQRSAIVNQLYGGWKLVVEKQELVHERGDT
jgi:hypothetical protein